MPGFRLVAAGSTERFELLEGRPAVVGRGAASDLVVADPTISRRHAELIAEADGVTVRDLASSNGTFVNGAQVGRAMARAGDQVGFGRVVFRVEAADPAPPAPEPEAAPIVRQVEVGAGVPPARKLALLLDISQRLSGEFDLDRLLERIGEVTLEAMPVDRMAVLLHDAASDQLTSRVARSRIGDLAAQPVPRSIVDKVIRERVAVLSDNAPADARFTGQSIRLQNVRSAMCVPLLAPGDRVLGLLYVDSVTRTSSFDDEDLQFLIAFGGIAALAIRNSRFAEELGRQAMVRSNFERYFAPNVAARISTQTARVRPGGERRPVTVLFSDIRGFTALAETMSPEAIAGLLGEYFSEMVELVFEHGGSLDKFVGDALMALWGAPTAHPEDPVRALAAARAMQRAVTELNGEWAAAGRPTIGIGIGINHGEVFAGNIGSARRLEYTVIGDAVNVASRLCSAAEAGEILVSGAFRQAGGAALGNGFEAAPGLELRGKARAVEVWRAIP